jgi:hypothetical protein
MGGYCMEKYQKTQKREQRKEHIREQLREHLREQNRGKNNLWSRPERVNNIVEKWFEERLSSTTNNVESKKCKKCNNVPCMSVSLKNCGHIFCSDCIVLHKELYNRCPDCKTVIDITKYEEYDGLAVKIPSYSEFLCRV